MSLKALTASLMKTGKDAILIPYLTDYLFRKDKLMETGKLSRQDVAIKDAKRSIQCLKRRIAEFDHDGSVKVDGAFHPSSMGKCRRQMFFSVFKAPEEPTSSMESLKRHMIFEFGTYFHMFFQNLCAEAGVLVKREVPFLIKDPLMQGHCDGIIGLENTLYVLELKTINSFEFARLTAPKYEHKQQAMAYVYALNKLRKYGKIMWAIIVYFDKGTSQMKEYVVRYDQNFVEEEILANIRKFFRQVRTKTLPERVSEDPTKIPCATCKFAKICFDTKQLVKFMRSISK